MANGIIATLRYEDCPAAIRWLTEVLEFEELLVVPGRDGRIDHAELHIGGEVVMVSSTPHGEAGRLNEPQGPAGMYLIADSAANVDAIYAHVRQAGAEVVMPIADADYGSRGFTIKDPEGNLWSIGTYRPALP